MSTTYQLLVGGRAFVDELCRALPACRRSLYAQFMTYEGDAAGQAFADLLIDKAVAGVDVRLVVDCYSDVVLSDVYPVLVHRLGAVRDERSRTHALFDRLRAHGVAVRRTAPPGFLGRYMLYRNHKKMVVLDGQIAFVGGINVSEHNYAWHDFMVKIEGLLVADLVRDFNSTWDGTPLALDTPRRDGDFVLNQCAGRYSIFGEVLSMIGRAEHTIAIESPYLLGDHIEKALRAADRGVHVMIILPAHSNKLAYRIWSRKLRRRLTHPNVAIYGYRGNGGMTHAKLLIVDHRWATFGSFNMIELEGLTQKELNIFSGDEDLIRQLDAFVTGNLAHAVRCPTPRTSLGRFSYTILYRFFKWWTQRLVADPAWKDVYC